MRKFSIKQRGKIQNINVILKFPALDFLIRNIKKGEFSKKFCHSLPYFYTHPASDATITNNQQKIVKNGNSNSQATLKKNLYDNARLEAPDGQLLCFCDSKKAMWYAETIGKKSLFRNKRFMLDEMT